MALSLAACGGSDDAAAVVGGGTATDDTAADDTAATPGALSALQSELSTIILSNSSGSESVEAATLATASNANALALTATTTAPTTVAGTQEVMGDAVVLAVRDLDALLTGTPAEDILEALGGGTFDGTDGVADFGLTVDALSAVTSADKVTLATQLGAINALITGNDATNTVALDAAKAVWGVGTALTAADASDIAAFDGVASLIAGNLSGLDNTDATAATQAELQEGYSAYASALLTAVISAGTLTVTAAQKAAALADLVDGADATIALLAPVQGANGAVSNHNAASTYEGDLAEAADAIDVALGGGTAAATAVTAAIALTAGGAGDIEAYIDAKITATYEAAVAAQYTALIDAMQTVADAQNAVDALDTQATLIELANDGTAVTIVTAATTAASTNDDLIGYVTDSDISTTIGSAAQAFGATGDDTLMIAGEYTFVTITEAQSDAIATEVLGDASVLEIFVYQDATSGDAVLHVERTAGEGNVEGTTMSTITLTDVTFADLGQTVADDMTVLTSAAVIA